VVKETILPDDPCLFCHIALPVTYYRRHVLDVLERSYGVKVIRHRQKQIHPPPLCSNIVLDCINHHVKNPWLRQLGMIALGAADRDEESRAVSNPEWRVMKEALALW